MKKNEHQRGLESIVKRSLVGRLYVVFRLIRRLFIRFVEIKKLATDGKRVSRSGRSIWLRMCGLVCESLYKHGFTKSDENDNDTEVIQ